MWVLEKWHLRKPRLLSPLRSLHIRNEAGLKVPLGCQDGEVDAQAGSFELLQTNIMATVYGLRREKTCLPVSDKVRFKPGLT